MSTLLSERPQPITASQLLERAAAQRSIPWIPARREPAALPSHPIITPRAGWSPLLDLIVATLREWRRRRAERRELALLDTRMLRDVGLDPGTVDYEASQSFWRPSRDWQQG
jgi:uncharacterized protein YjiS (DUF1127 family)